MIKCKICNQDFKIYITNTHLKHKHCITLKEYIEDYGEESITCPEYKKKRHEESKGENNPNFGNKWSDEQKEHLSELAKGREPWNKDKKMSEEFCENIKERRQKEEADRKINNIPHHSKDRSLSKETRDKISEALTGKNYFTEESKRKRTETLRKKKENGWINPRKNKKSTTSKRSRQKAKIKAAKTNLKRRLNLRQPYLERIKQSNLTLLNENILDNIFKLRCNECNHEFTRNKNCFIESKWKKEICDQCFPISLVSKGELEVLDFIKTLLPGHIIKSSDMEVLNTHELDIFIPELNFAIEYCGLYWHSEQAGKNKFYHMKKMKECNKIGVSLVTLFEDEWLLKTDIVKSMLKQKLNKSDYNININDCIIQEVDNTIAEVFLNENDLYGYKENCIHCGLYYNDILVKIMSYEYNDNMKYKWSIRRDCNRLNYNIIDPNNLLFNYFISEQKPTNVVAFIDLRWYDYLYLNKFKEIKTKTIPNYWYCYGNKMRVKAVDINNKKYNIIWDCGYKKYEWLKE